MATVTGLTAERMLEIEAGSVVDGDINGSGHLILTKHDGSTIDAGSALVAVPDASATAKGVVELATTAEVTTGTDTTRAITPAGLKAGFIIPDASATAKGIVELATSAEAITGTDTVRAVTPAGLASVLSPFNAADISLDGRLDALEALPGYKTVLLADNSILESALITSYPFGVSLMAVSLGPPTWSLNGGYGHVVTFYKDTSRAFQEFHAHQSNDTWKRTYYSGSWNSWTMTEGNEVTSTVAITPPINTATSFSWNYGKTLPTPVRVFATANTTVPGTVVEVAATSVTATSALIWVYRSTNVLTNIQVMAVGGRG